jgi:hypothetical protein
MDQIAALNAVDPTQGLKDEELVNVHVSVAKASGKPAGLYSAYFMKGEYKANRAKRIDRFRGSLRLVRFGSTLHAFYRNEGASTWKSFGAFPFDRRATGIGLGVRNFEMRKATSIGAKSPFTASFDNFRVNAAQEITESEISHPV